MRAPEALHLVFVGPHPAGGLPTSGRTLADHLAADGAHVHISSTLANRWVRPIDMLLHVARLARRADAVIINTFAGRLTFAYVTVVATVARLLGAPVILIFNDGRFPDFAARFPAWVRRVARMADAIVTPSGYLQQQLLPFGIEAREISNIVEVPRPPAPALPNDARILWARAFHPLYDPMLALRAFEIVRASCPDAVMVMAGKPGELSEECRGFVAARDLAVSFPGQLSVEELADEAARSALYVNSNVVDNAPVTVVQMQALGVPVVATRAGGVPFLVADETDGLLVEPGDPEALAAAVVRVLTDRGLAQRLRIGGLASADRYRWPMVRDRWLALLSELPARRTRSGSARSHR